ncbi:MAG: hypothetical protein BWY44_01033 [Candidatus Omnitrophica bacterium ADurb.Bin292]|nr:MAG: hypothetical protein BWY44_01033 [Candidatus Omnitrophica bacterium ADurb.Bin292]
MKIKILFALTILGAIAAFGIVLNSGKKIQADPKTSPSYIELSFSLPAGYQFTQSSPYQLSCESENPDIVKLSRHCGENFSPLHPPYPIAFRGNPGETNVKLTGVFYYCHQETQMCFYDTFETSFPVVVKNHAPSVISRTWDIQPKRISEP